MHIVNNWDGFVVMVWDISKNKRATAELVGRRMDSPLDE
jgi:hypothetical protein